MADAKRGNANARGYGRRWRVESKRWLAQHPFCVECVKEGRPLMDSGADVVDHIKPHRGDPLLFWDRSNWQGLCYRHHGRKTGRGQ